MSDADIDRYDAGLLGDGGGGNVEWWHDYLRAELSRAHEFYARQMAEFFEMLEGMKTGVGTRVGDLESEITSLRTELAALRERVESGPQWRDKPTCPGWWVVLYPALRDQSHLDIQYYDDSDMNSEWDGLEVYGPIPAYIPTDTSKETGE